MGLGFETVSFFDERSSMNPDFLLAGDHPADLRQIVWPEKLRLLVTAPHPDDFDAIGVTLAYMREQGHELHVVVAETGSGIDKVYGAGMTREDRSLLRVREQTGSFRFFGLPQTHFRFLKLNNADDDQVADDEENRDFLEKLVRDIRPDMLFMPHGNDTNRAHRAMYTMMKAIASKVEWPVALMLNSDVKTVDMRKDFYLAFDETDAQWKSRLLRYHDSQHQRNLRDRGYGFDDRVLMLNRKTATELGIAEPYAASFELEWCR